MTSEIELYRNTLTAIICECATIEALNFGDVDMERRMLRAHNTKMMLYAKNALERFKPKENLT